MITEPQEYVYVTGANVDADHPHGDMDRVIFDGGVMPLRTGNTESFFPNGDPIPRKNIMRGEDICFLLEALRERSAAIGWTPGVLDPDDDGGPEVFTRRLSLNQVDTLHVAFRDLGARTEWVPRDTGLPQSGVIDSLSDADIAAAWPGVASWPSGPSSDAAWAAISPYPPLIPHREPIENMFEDMKLMRACRRDGAINYQDFTVRVVYSDGTVRTENAPKFASKSMTGGWQGVGQNSTWETGGSTAQLQSVAANTAVSGLPVGALFRPVVIVEGFASMITRNRSTGTTTTDLSFSKYALVTGGEHIVRDNGIAYCQQSEYEAAGQYMLNLMTAAGYDGNYVQSQTSDKDAYKVLNMYINFVQLLVFVRLGDHTKWWSGGG